MKKYGLPQSIVTERLRAYSAAMKEISAADRHEVGGRLNNRGENSHQPFRRRERAMQQFRSMKTLQKFSSVHSQVHNQFNQSGAASRHPAGLQAETLDGIDEVARPCRVRRRLRAGVSRYASANAVTLTTPSPVRFTTGRGGRRWLGRLGVSALSHARASSSSVGERAVADDTGD
jgi:hypothetical protein